MKLLILGSGFEINFNEKLKDFNNDFKIINHNTQEKVLNLNNIMQITGRSTISNIFEEKYLIKCINQLIDKIKNKQNYNVE